MGVHDLVCSLWPLASSSRASALAADAVPLCSRLPDDSSPCENLLGCPALHVTKSTAYVTAGFLLSVLR